MWQQTKNTTVDSDRIKLAGKRLFYSACGGLSWFNIGREWRKAHTVNMITAGLYKICTQILIRSINSVSAVSDKLGHSCKAGLLASGGFTLRRNTHSCCRDEREESGTLTERGGWTGWQIVVVVVVKADIWSFFFSWEKSILWLRIEICTVSFCIPSLWHLLDITNSILLFL